MFKKVPAAVGLFTMTILLSGTVHALENTKKNISVIDNGVITQYQTAAETVKEFLIEQNINLSGDDKLNLKSSDDIKDKMQIEIERPFIKKVLIDSEQKDFIIDYNETVGELLNKIKSEYGYDFICEKDLSAKIRNCQDLSFSSRQIKIIEQKEIIPFETKTEFSYELQKGTEKIIQNGINGEKLVSYEITLIAGEEISRTVESENIITNPTEEIIVQGTSEYKNILVMNASAYTAGYESTGKRPGDKGYGITKCGTKASMGTVAVDPRVIQLGSKLYVEGYGYATAWDTGGAIKGNKIDLFYDNLYEAKKFGRKNITVYVLY